MSIKKIWNNIKDEFKNDGSLKDIIGFKTDFNDWKKILKYINSNYKTLYLFNNEKMEYYELKEEHFSSGEINLNFNIKDISMSCNFFEEEQIQFTFNPKDIKSEKYLEYLLIFIIDIYY